MRGTCWKSSRSGVSVRRVFTVFPVSKCRSRSAAGDSGRDRSGYISVIADLGCGRTFRVNAHAYAFASAAGVGTTTKNRAEEFSRTVVGDSSAEAK